MQIIGQYINSVCNSKSSQKYLLLKGNNNKQNKETIKTQKKRNNEVLN